MTQTEKTQTEKNNDINDRKRFDDTRSMLY